VGRELINIINEV